MAYRQAQIYIQFHTLKLLRLVGKLYPAGSAMEAESTDELADKLLLEVIATRYKRAIELVKAQDKLEKEAIEAGKHIILDA